MAKARSGKWKGKSFFSEKWKTDKFGYTWHSAKNTALTCRVSSSAKSVRLKLAQLVVDQTHHAPRLRPDQCMLCRQVGHRASECPNKGKATGFSPGKRAFGTYALGCAVFDSQCYGATVEEIEQDQDDEVIEAIVAFSIRSLEGFAILDGGATKTVSGFLE